MEFTVFTYYPIGKVTGKKGLLKLSDSEGSVPHGNNGVVDIDIHGVVGTLLAFSYFWDLYSTDVVSQIFRDLAHHSTTINLSGRFLTDITRKSISLCGDSKS